MNFEVEHVSQIAVIKVTEGLVGEESVELVTAVKQCLEGGTRQLIVDLSDPGKVDEGGLASLVRAYIEVVKQGGKLVAVISSSFFGGQPHPHSPIMELYRTREEAIGALLDPKHPPDQAKSKASGCTTIARTALLISALFLLATWLI
jgi:hypothetical protein